MDKDRFYLLPNLHDKVQFKPEIKTAKLRQELHKLH